MPVAWAVSAFLAGAVVSLATSWLLVSRLERVGERLGLSEALLGIVAALAADAPEVTAAITAMASHQQRLGAGVVLGSNVFNLAALLGLGAVVAGRDQPAPQGGRPRRHVALRSPRCLALVGSAVRPPACGLALAARRPRRLPGRPGPGPAGLHLPRPPAIAGCAGGGRGGTRTRRRHQASPGQAAGRAIAAVALGVVIVASVTMERAASSARAADPGVPEIIIGGLVLAAVTSLPNAVAAVWLAAGAAVRRPSAPP